jgi:small subunit ribosomal protein S3
MGQKVHPTGIRLGIIKKHTSVWYASSATYADKLLADIKARTFIQKKLASASVSRVDIERPSQSARVTIHSARPWHCNWQEG